MPKRPMEPAAWAVRGPRAVPEVPEVWVVPGGLVVLAVLVVPEPLAVPAVLVG